MNFLLERQNGRKHSIFTLINFKYLTGFFPNAIVNGSFTKVYGNEDDLQILLIEYGPVVTALNAAPLHHYHSGLIEGTLGNSDYTCCNAKTDNLTKKPDDYINYNYYYYDYDDVSNSSDSDATNVTNNVETTSTEVPYTTTDSDIHYYDDNEQEYCR